MGELGAITGGALITLILSLVLARVPSPMFLRPVWFVFAPAFAYLVAFVLAVGFGGMSQSDATLSYGLPTALFAIAAFIWAIARMDKSNWNGWHRVRVVMLCVVTFGVVFIFRGAWEIWPILMLPPIIFWLAAGTLGWVFRGFVPARD